MMNFSSTPLTFKNSDTGISIVRDIQERISMLDNLVELIVFTPREVLMATRILVSSIGIMSIQTYTIVNLITNRLDFLQVDYTMRLQRKSVKKAYAKVC